MADTRNQEELDSQAEVISQHLHPRFTGACDAITEDGDDGRDGNSAGNDENQQSSLRMQGGDIHRDIYRIQARSRWAGLHQRASTFSYSPRLEADDDPDTTIRNGPGGFRRQFLARSKRGVTHISTPKSFVDFLQLYGRFAGEDLAESEDETDAETNGATVDEAEAERRPLLAGRESSRGDASDVKTFFTLLKAFIGTSIIFLPKAFSNGGILFSSIALITVSIMTTTCFHLLLECQRRYGGGYGDIGEAISSRHLRSLIRISITTSQLGFVCAAIAFTADNLLSFVESVATDYIRTPSSISIIIALQLVVLVPLAFIRKITRLGGVALLADVFIFIAIGYIYYSDLSKISRNGLEPTVRLFNPNKFVLVIGSSVFLFEGIGLVLPIQSSMSHPHHFGRILNTVMALITFFFASVGILSYGAFGTDKDQYHQQFSAVDQLRQLRPLVFLASRSCGHSNAASSCCENSGRMGIRPQFWPASPCYKVEKESVQDRPRRSLWLDCSTRCQAVG
ncbi:Amino acid transporter, transmembrane [Penicillium italicum]|uniref:Amino acid transporter, transmembrane n=1 Tax=Penicillium italicum TaxID=40296 RepID=A0A0A2KNI9_PENIT|nr:Amino acid transporter, transmembrane [Penicillium italicum]